jgi:large subunit ribosomal protein L1
VRSKTYQHIKEKMPVQAVDLAEGIKILKEQARRKFDETVELHVCLRVDSSKSDHTVRGMLTLPAGAIKEPRIIVIAKTQEEQRAAQEAGALQTGGEELIEEIAAAGKVEADSIIATPAMMPKIAKVAKILGPQGLMPNPKTGSVTPDPVAAVKELKAGKISFKMDQHGNIHLPVAKLSWDTAKIMANSKAALEAIMAAKPAAFRGQLIGNVTIKSTMSPGIKVTVSN